MFLSRDEKRESLTLTAFQTQLEASKVASATIQDRSNMILGTLSDGTKFKVSYPGQYSDDVTRDLKTAKVAEVIVNPQNPNLWVSLLFNLLPFIIVIAAFVWIIGSVQGGGGRLAQFGKSKARMLSKDAIKMTFADVAGNDEAIEELREIKDFLENPAKFVGIGAKIPKGVLLYGPPGTGKTLLARAVAGEAGVPFFSISGSDFVEMFVGVGAARVRDLFEQAKSHAPAIIFVDEIDAVGRHRGAGLGGGHDEREQTLNQLLVEMDGFDVKSGVILIAATNRPDILDPALLRPGRFDRQIVVDRPDLEGRKAILNVHAKGKPLGKDVDLEVLARRTPGFTGADLANLMNEAALLTARRGGKVVDMSAMEDAIDRVIAGPERKSRVMSDKEKAVIAYHESGHALVGHVLPNTDPIHKVSIVARGRALGWTLALPTEDKHMQTRSELRDQLAMLLAGRTAEELVFGDPTTGAQDDIERATHLARAMVTEFGMTDALGPQQLGNRASEPFLGREMGGQRDYSDEVSALVDAEVRKLIDAAHDEARRVLRQHRDVLDRLADALVEKETLDTADLATVFGDLATWDSKGDGRATGKSVAKPTKAPARTAGKSTTRTASPARRVRAPRPAT